MRSRGSVGTTAPRRRVLLRASRLDGDGEGLPELARRRCRRWAALGETRACGPCPWRVVPPGKRLQPTRDDIQAPPQNCPGTSPGLARLSAAWRVVACRQCASAADDRCLACVRAGKPNGLGWPRRGRGCGVAPCRLGDFGGDFCLLVRGHT
ncbi:unnamed protein product [Hapterophycus canaliculatus]